jgi:hypothetical protein
MPNKFTSAIKRGVTAVQTAYQKQVKAEEARARLRMKHAKTRYEKERVKAELEQEKLVLQRQMYEAKAKVVTERKAVIEARHRAGVVTWGERAESAGRSLGREGRKLGGELWRAGKGLMSEKPKRRTTRRKTTRHG